MPRSKGSVQVHCQQEVTSLIIEVQYKLLRHSCRLLGGLCLTLPCYTNMPIVFSFLMLDTLPDVPEWETDMHYKATTPMTSCKHAFLESY